MRRRSSTIRKFLHVARAACKENSCCREKEQSNKGVSNPDHPESQNYVVYIKLGRKRAALYHSATRTQGSRAARQSRTYG